MKETRLGEFEEVILLLVGILGEDEAYAFKIADEFESQTGRSVSIGAVHSTLSRLEEKGFLNSEMGTIYFYSFIPRNRISIKFFMLLPHLKALFCGMKIVINLVLT